MVWGAMNVCFFGFLRSGEAWAPSPKSYDPTWHLCIGDLGVIRFSLFSVALGGLCGKKVPRYFIVSVNHLAYSSYFHKKEFVLVQNNVKEFHFQYCMGVL